MTTIELLSYLKSTCFQLTELHQHPKYDQLCKDAKKAGNPSVGDALDAVLYAIKWAESQSE
jgi:hypothetical protein